MENTTPENESKQVPDLNPHDTRSDHARFHDELDKLRHRGWRITEAGSQVPFIREATGRPKGKKALRLAKRQKVKQLKKQSLQ